MSKGKWVNVVKSRFTIYFTWLQPQNDIPFVRHGHQLNLIKKIGESMARTRCSFHTNLMACSSSVFAQLWYPSLFGGSHSSCVSRARARTHTNHRIELTKCWPSSVGEGGVHGSARARKYTEIDNMTTKRIGKLFLIEWWRKSNDWIQTNLIPSNGHTDGKRYQHLAKQQQHHHMHGKLERAHVCRAIFGKQVWSSHESRVAWNKQSQTVDGGA